MECPSLERAAHRRQETAGLERALHALRTFVPRGFGGLCSLLAAGRPSLLQRQAPTVRLLETSGPNEIICKQQQLQTSSTDCMALAHKQQNSPRLDHNSQTAFALGPKRESDELQ
jgi:hypothetical protein